jgi:hypothetical protein
LGGNFSFRPGLKKMKGIAHMNPEAERPRIVIAEIAIELMICALLLASSFRLVSVSLLFLYLALRVLRWPQTGRLALCVGLLFIASEVQPLDVSFGSTRYRRFGTPGHGLQFVPVVFGLPNHVFLREHYKEYICGGCCAPVIEPKWVLTWN